MASSGDCCPQFLQALVTGEVRGAQTERTCSQRLRGPDTGEARERWMNTHLRLEEPAVILISVKAPSRVRLAEFRASLARALGLSHQTEVQSVHIALDHDSEKLKVCVVERSSRVSE